METKNCFGTSRRHFVGRASALVAAAALLGPPALLSAEKKKSGETDVTPTEDLMREHGVLRRLMLIFDEFAKRLHGAAEVPPALIAQSAEIIRTFIQDYHEVDEEVAIFPRFIKAGKLTGLVKTLLDQHHAGRRLIATLETSVKANLKDQAGREKVSGLMAAFNRMYRPHAAWEDTILYPAFRSVISPKDFEALGDQFEDKEQKKFGKDGFEKIVAEVAELEKQLGLFDLAQFTPKL
ncbi:MAG: hemerythrin domain-containing protein [Deltaproteobacteria bacterium]|nr:hemerythrin domain-containing protein [Deltaproteobacteria bacterium]